MLDYVSSYGSSGYDSYDAYSGYDDYDEYGTTSPYYYSYSQPKNNSTIASTIAGVGLVTWIIIITFVILTIIGIWKAFVKAGYAGWESLIGGHNTFVRFEISGIKPYWIFLLLVPIVNIFILFWLNIEFAKSYGRSIGFGIGLTLLPGIFFPILGLGGSQYMGPAYYENNYNNAQQNYNNPQFDEQYNPRDNSQIVNNQDNATADMNQNNIQQDINNFNTSNQENNTNYVQDLNNNPISNDSGNVNNSDAIKQDNDNPINNNGDNNNI